MAEITFGTYTTANLGGSGLGFYGSTFGSSVQIGAYNQSTFITNANGTANGGSTFNNRYTAAASGEPYATGSGIPLIRINGYHRTLDINFDHTTPVNVQNVQFRIYDRANINNPASGVNTKVAELVNFNGQSYSSWLSTPGDANTANDAVGGSPRGSGDLVWWGDPWPTSHVSQGYYENSSGIRFLNGRVADSVTNGDSRLAGVAGADDTVGGTGVIVPLLNSPGSGQRFLDGAYDTAFKPKWLQYYNTSNPDVPNIGVNTTTRTFGGTGVDRRHTWRLALSATPLSVGSKEQFAAYVSLEYL